MKRRSKVSQAASGKKLNTAQLNLKEARGLVSPISGKSTTVALRLSGPWHELWEGLKAAVPDVSDAELLRQAVALRVALAAQDGRGKKPRATIEYHDEQGQLVSADLEDYVGIARPQENS